MGVDVAVVLTSFRAGGAERMQIALANEIANRGFAVDVVTLDESGPLASLVGRSVRRVKLGSPRASRAYRHLRSYFQSAAPYGVVSAQDHLNALVIMAARRSGVRKVVAAVHTTLSVARRQEAPVRGSLLQLAVQITYPFADAVVAVSQGVANDLGGILIGRRSQVSVIYNPVIGRELEVHAASVPLRRDTRERMVVAVGRLTPAKDYPTLLRGFALVLKEIDARLVILGEGGERALVEREIRALGLTEKVELRGFVGNPYPVVRAADLFVLSSKREGLPTVLIEALALGVPVVSTDCHSGPREILESGRLGLLVPVGDPAALARAMVQQLRTPLAVPTSDLSTKYGEEAAATRYLAALGLSRPPH